MPSSHTINRTLWFRIMFLPLQVSCPTLGKAKCLLWLYLKLSELLSEVFQLLENDMSHGEKAQWLLSSIFLPTSKVTLKLCFLQALGFSKGAHMHLFTCHKYRDTFLLLSDKNPGKSQSKAKLLLHQQSPWKACQITLCEWVWR